MSIRMDWPGLREAFENEYLQQTAVIDGSDNRLWRGAVELCVEFNKNRHPVLAKILPAPKPSRIVTLFKIRSYTYGQGHGSHALDWIQNTAAKDGMAIALRAYPLDLRASNPMRDPEKLLKWYEKRGFVKDPRYCSYEHLVFNY